MIFPRENLNNFWNSSCIISSDTVRDVTKGKDSDA